jgi:hypothetical protein
MSALAEFFIAGGWDRRASYSGSSSAATSAVTSSVPATSSEQYNVLCTAEPAKDRHPFLRSLRSMLLRSSTLSIAATTHDISN